VLKDVFCVQELAAHGTTDSSLAVLVVFVSLRAASRRAANASCEPASQGSGRTQHSVKLIKQPHHGARAIGHLRLRLICHVGSGEFTLA
jgi:hypothetical protein